MLSEHIENLLEVLEESVNDEEEISVDTKAELLDALLQEIADNKDEE